MKKTTVYSRLTNVKHKGSVGSNKSVKRDKNIYPNFDANGNVYFSEEKAKIFDDIDTKELQRHIAAYRSIDMRTASEEEIFDAASKILSQNLVSTFNIDEGKEFYRARSKTHIFNGVEDLYRDFSELWYPDAKYLTKMGRLNGIGQQIMYASLDALTPIHEIRSANDTQFALMKYKVKDRCNLRLSTIAYYTHGSLVKSLEKNVKWTKKGLRNWKIINDFLSTEFTKKVIVGQEYIYKSTNTLLRFVEAHDSDGFLYPSIERNGGYNIALKPKSADEKVDFVGLAYFKNNYYDNDKLLRNDFMCFRKWSVEVVKNKIVYAPEGKCPIPFLKLINGELRSEIYHENDIVPTERNSKSFIAK